ncbi:MAG: phosphoribosylformylglycinamidine synthase [Kiritimatiellaeota bacterium]|nr:phosphoribosylformylglycinamidine synthase [Kiritimatiellota bacterium]
MMVLQGGDAFPKFRLDALREMAGGAVEARFVYLLETEDALDAGAMARVCALLGASEEAVAEGGFFVLPRRGTVSPWSSKAGEFLRGCGVEGVVRVERGIHYSISNIQHPTPNNQVEASARCGNPLDGGCPVLNVGCLHDRMREGVYTGLADFFACLPPQPGRSFDVLGRGAVALEEANRDMSLALSDEEVRYLFASYTAAGRNPTDTELVMFGQVNSEHCRHKIFNAEWVIDGKREEMSLFQMIKNTHACHPEGTLSAYKDNSGVAEGAQARMLLVDPVTRAYAFELDQVDILMKAETHNHPSAVSPYPGGATGVGGEIRDEAATGTGAGSKAGLAGVMVSNLNVPGFRMPWEKDFAEFPGRLTPSLGVALEGAAGCAAYGNESGRPTICGFLRTYEEEVAGRYRGYHKPILLAGGMGNIRRRNVQKKEVVPGALVVQLGGPAMRIGLGGGAASSLETSSSGESLDFDSVQRGNAEIQRRCQGVIDACVALGDANPILSIHDVGAGGLSNACPELIERTGATFQLRDIPNADRSLSPMEIWCCEAQERYVLVILPKDRAMFETLCARERCPVAFIGVARDDRRLVLEDSHFGDRPIDMDIGVLLGKPPRMVRDVKHAAEATQALDLAGVTPEDALLRVLRLPAVADKTFLAAGADRTVTGLVSRDPMVGRYQLPMADCAVTATGYQSTTGEAMAMGERTLVALLDGPASGRMAVAEALANIAAADVGPIGNVKLSANWMCACGEAGEDAKLFDTVRAVGMDFCPRVGVAIPVGKDSLSMRTVWQDSAGASHRQVAPLSLVVSAFAPVRDVRKTLTPDLKPGSSTLLLLDLGQGRNRLGASALAQVYNQVGECPPDADDPALVRAFFDAVQELVAQGLLLAYHDRSDGGVAVTLAEMAMAGGRGASVELPGADAFGALFSEEPGAIVQVANENLDAVMQVLAKHGLAKAPLCVAIGHPTDDPVVKIKAAGNAVIDMTLRQLRRAWSELSYRIRTLRDNPACAAQEYDNALDEQDPGMTFKVTFDPDEAAPIQVSQRPRVAILREQGMSGYAEMGAAFTLAGFEAADVHMTDLLEGRVDLADAQGLAAGGGFSYGDVLGAGLGWAQGILSDARLAEMFKRFFERPDTFTLGVNNGCQMLSQLKGLIPGAAHWPAFRRNASEQFEARYTTVEVLDSPSVLLRGMAGSRLPIAVAHSEGFAEGGQGAVAALRFVDGRGEATERYPWNPNGSKGGQTGFTSGDGRATILMPHPERGFRAVQLSYKPAGLFTREAGPWMRMFRNAYAFVAR